MPALIIIGVVFLGLIIWVAATYNSLVSLKQHMRESWADIDVEMKRRYDLIPNLVETVKGYAAHEKDVLSRMVELRKAAMASHDAPSRQTSDETAMLMGLRQVFAVAENYPTLKADANFRQLQTQLAETEDRIAAARRFYNGNVRDLNQLCQSFPSNMIAGMFGFTTQTYFELSSEAERVVPRVSV